MKICSALLIWICALFLGSCTPAKKDGGELAGLEQRRTIVAIPKTNTESAPPEAAAPDAGGGRTETASTPPPVAGSAGGSAPIRPPPSGCEDDVILERQCWTEKFPPEMSGKSDIACKFSLTCCGLTVQSWSRSYPQSASSRGVVLNDIKHTQQKCRTVMTALDIDGDGTDNPLDDNPLGAGGGNPWE